MSTMLENALACARRGSLLSLALFTWLFALVTGDLEAPKILSTFTVDGNVWQAVEDAEGKGVYYYDTTNAKSTWRDPRMQLSTKRWVLAVFVTFLPAGISIAAGYGLYVWMKNAHPDKLKKPKTFKKRLWHR